MTQIIYMIPAILSAHRLGQRDIEKGLIVGAAGTLLLAAACWVLSPLA